jgi:hypothetical protein
MIGDPGIRSYWLPNKYQNEQADIGCLCGRSLKSKASKKHSKEYSKARARYPSPEY